MEWRPATLRARADPAVPGPASAEGNARPSATPTSRSQSQTRTRAQLAAVQPKQQSAVAVITSNKVVTLTNTPPLQVSDEEGDEPSLDKNIPYAQKLIRKLVHNTYLLLLILLILCLLVKFLRDKENEKRNKIIDMQLAEMAEKERQERERERQSSSGHTRPPQPGRD